MKKIKSVRIFNNKTVAAGGTEVSDIVNIERCENFAIHIETFTGGAAKSIDLSYSVCRTESGTFISPSENNLIADDLKATDAIIWSPVTSKFVRFSCLNNDVADCVITAYLLCQEVD